MTSAAAFAVTPDDERDDLGRDILRSTSDAVPALISFFDADHVCRLANDHHTAWYGRSPDELVGLHMREFLGQDAYEQRLPFLERVASGEQVSFEAKVPYLNGGWRDAAIRYVPRMGPGGFEGFHTLVFDLTREQHRFHSVFDGTAVGFWEIDLTDMRALLSTVSENPVELSRLIAADLTIVRRALDVTTVTGLNAKASAMFGVDRGAAVGRPLGDWVPAAGLAGWNRNLLAYLAGEESYETETAMLREDGSQVDVLLSCAFPKDPDEQVIVMIGVVDISERVAKEKELARTQADLAHAARVATLGELMASIAHEVNQPLAAVVVNGNTALRWLRQVTPVDEAGRAAMEEARAALGRIISEGARASEIIARTRQMAMKGGETRADFDLASMIHDAVEITRRQTAALGATLAVSVAPGLPAVTGDRIQLQQVVINLIVNAAQAMSGASGAVRHIEVEAGHRDRQIVVEVRDTGPGMDEETCRRVFEAFFTTKEDGMGMGLSIARSIVEAHDGTISAWPREGGGTLFRIVLPEVPTIRGQLPQR
ncbi:ATP-binding protein [Sphingomonas sp. DT-51]|uniref:PAS domain-containing sensor histidine kinase n=1 Tax=Sphingomonas sp. DT-51 TaxID=3396165 RepID=UPI003F1ACB8D